MKSIGNLNLRYVAIIFGLFVLGANRPSIAKQPNVVLVIADDQSWFDAGCYGSQVVKTPNIDKLAREGMRFDRAFTATAMCALRANNFIQACSQYETAHFLITAK